MVYGIKYLFKNIKEDLMDNFSTIQPDPKCICSYLLVNNMGIFFYQQCLGFIKEILTLLRGQQRYASVFPAQQVLPSGHTVLLSGQETPETGLSRGRKNRVSQCAMATNRGRRVSPLIWRKKN